MTATFIRLLSTQDKSESLSPARPVNMTRSECYHAE